MLTNNDEIYSHVIDDDIKFDDESNLTDHDKNKVLFPTVLHKIDGSAITSEQIVNIAPGDG